MVSAKFTGSKRKTRLAQMAARRDKAFKKRLGRIYELSQLIKSEAELDTYLASIADDEVRAETRKVIEPFLLFELKRVVLTDAPPPPKLNPVSPLRLMEL